MSGTDTVQASALAPVLAGEVATAGPAGAATRSSRFSRPCSLIPGLDVTAGELHLRNVDRVPAQVEPRVGDLDAPQVDAFWQRRWA